MTRSPRAAERRKILKWLRILADRTRGVVSDWNVDGRVLVTGQPFPFRARRVDEYPENSADAWRVLARDAANMRDAWDRIATHAAEQARIINRENAR